VAWAGPPGTGKTHWLLHILLPLLRHSKADGSQHQVLIAASSNDPVNDIALQLSEMADRLAPALELVIVHAVATKAEVVWQPAERERPHPEDSRPKIYQQADLPAELDSMVAAMTVIRFYEHATARPHRIADRRLRHLKLSLGHWMLRFAGFLPSRHQDPKEFRKFRELFEQYRHGQTFDQHTMEDFRMETKRLRQAVLLRARAVAATLSRAGEASLREEIRPDVIAVDEAAKATEPELWNVLGGYNPRGI
jgi:hypothetical protein